MPPTDRVGGGFQGAVPRDRYPIVAAPKLTPGPCSHILNAAPCPRAFRRGHPT